MPSHRTFSGDAQARLWILGAFVVSRIAYFLAGVRFQAHLILFNYQFIDIELLKNRLAESLFYYHMSPPGLNLMVGLLAKAFPSSYGEAMHAVYMACGAAASILLFQLMRRLNARPRVAAVLTILFIASPACVLFENYPMYEYPMATLLLGLCVAFARLLERPGFGRASAFFAVLAGLALMRAFFHPYYLVMVAGAVAWYLKPHARTVLAASAIPLALIFALCVKNAFVFGFFGTSSWMGNTWPTITTHNLSQEECHSLVESGKLDPFGCVEGVQPPANYLRYITDLKPTGIPVLDQEVKTGGEGNYNHQVYLETGKRFTRTALQVFRYFPEAYVRSEMVAWFCYFRPGTDFPQFEENRIPIRGFDRVFNAVMFGQFREAPNKELRALRSEGGTLALPLYTGTFLIIGLPLILLLTAYFWMRDYHREPRPSERLALTAFVVIQIVMIATIANFLSSYENNRYRFPTDPLYVALAGSLIGRVVKS